jgi:hypothetical protein
LSHFTVNLSYLLRSLYHFCLFSRFRTLTQWNCSLYFFLLFHVSITFYFVKLFFSLLFFSIYLYIFYHFLTSFVNYLHCFLHSMFLTSFYFTCFFYFILDGTAFSHLTFVFLLYYSLFCGPTLFMGICNIFSHLCFNLYRSFI